MMDDMTQPQPGWYPDPADPSRHRYWAGDAWTAETRQIEATPAPTTPAFIPTTDPYASFSVAKAGPVPVLKPTTQQQSAHPQGVPQGQMVTTADGVKLAGWWWRVLATVLDSVLLGIIMTFVMQAIPNLMTGVEAWMSDLLGGAINQAGTIPAFTDPAYGLERPMIIYLVINLLVSCLYAFVMLKLAGATLGQLACGLRVVPLDYGEHRGGLPTGMVLARTGMYTVIPQAISLISAALMFANNQSMLSTILSVASLYPVLNALWGAWDSKRQCWHDKVAHTQVVRR